MMKNMIPIAKKIPFQHQYFGKTWKDPYHWLKDQSNSKKQEIIDYLNQENEYCQNVHLLPNKELTNTIYNEIVSRIKEDDASVPVKKGIHWYYNYTIKDKQYPVYARKRDSLDNTEQEILLDQNALDFEYIDLHTISVSPNSKLVGYSLDLDGSENYSISLKDLETLEVQENIITKAAGPFVWSNDCKAIYYTVLDEIHRSCKVYRHVLGSDSKDDELIFHEMDEKFEVGISKSNSEKFIFITTESTLTTETHYLDASIYNTEVKLFQPREFKHKYYVEHWENYFVILSDEGGQSLNYELFSCPLTSTSKTCWKSVLEYDPYKHLLDIIPFKDFLAVYECFNGLKNYRILSFKSNGVLECESSFNFKDDVYFTSPSDSYEQVYDSNNFRYKYESMIFPPQTFQYDFKESKSNMLKETVVLGGYDPKDYQIERIYAPIPDDLYVEGPFNTPIPREIPISIVYKKSLFSKDGSNPCLMYGYGSYGISIDPQWNYGRFSLLDRGYVYAIAHIRGGGDLGRAWYETGKFKHKKNTFQDFIHCGEELIKQGYTDSKHLAIEGRSAGGLLIGSTINMRPDLAAVAVAGVPFVDVINTMMDPTIPLTIDEYEEWGNPNEQDYFDYMAEYSPYENIKEKAHYPDLLVKAGLTDPRVQYWEPAKWVAKLRETVHSNQIVFECKMGSGHFGASGRYDYLKEIAADYSYIIDRIAKTKKTL